MTGVLRVRSENDSGDVFFRDGQVVHSACGAWQGMEAFCRILSLKEGEIELNQGILPSEESIDMPWDGLLVQAMAELEGRGIDAAPPEPALVAKRAAAEDILRLHRLYSHAMDWEEVQSCLIYDLDGGEVIRPAGAPERVRRWGDVFGALFQTTRETSPLEAEIGPYLICATMDKRIWALVPDGSHLIALEVTRGVDVRRFHRKVKMALRENGLQPGGSTSMK